MRSEAGCGLSIYWLDCIWWWLVSDWQEFNLGLSSCYTICTVGTISATLNMSFLVYKLGWVGTTHIIGQWQGCNEGPSRRSLEYSGTSTRNSISFYQEKKKSMLSQFIATDWIFLGLTCGPRQFLIWCGLEKQKGLTFWFSASIHVRMRARAHTHAHTPYTLTHVHTHITCSHTCLHACIDSSMHWHTCLCIHMHTRTHKCTHTSTV